MARRNGLTWRAHRSRSKFLAAGGVRSGAGVFACRGSGGWRHVARDGFGAGAEEKLLGLDSIFVLTTRTMHWFIKRGFQQVDPEWLPEERKRKYNWDRRSLVLVKKFN